MFPVVEVPKDEAGFVQSFTISQTAEYQQFFRTFGFVVIDKVLTPECVDGTIDEIWNHIESTPTFFDGVKVDRNDTSTWEDCFFPGFKKVGIVGDGPCLGKYTWANRQNSNIYEAFSVLYGERKLWVSVDRWGFMRPTRNVPIGKLKNPKTIRISVEGDEVAEIGRGTIVLQKTRNVKADLTLSTSVVADKLEWKTRSSWLHWDLNPWVWTSGDEGIDYKFEEFIEENNGSRNDGNLKLQVIRFFLLSFFLIK
eukprot:TRINITY_DN188_c0_g1_i9.p1 TRINITY_DN188_c0_g1~~TRINITY_DN188_c0_g1_i9.p1  ORF type:complete len:253 (-),score=38.55 TRINITY_DN188_c0_g1_i9:679-1437(-)